MIKKENYKELFAFSLLVVTEYVNKFQPQLSSFKNEIAADLIETRDDWKPEDIINFFKFVRTHKTEETKMYGAMNYDRLMELLPIYEQEKSNAREVYHARHKGQLSEENKSLDKISPKLLERFTSRSDAELITKDAGMGKEFDRVQAERERTGKNVIYPQVVPDEKYFNSKK